MNYCTKLKCKLFAFVVVVCINDKLLASVGHNQAYRDDLYFIISWNTIKEITMCGKNFVG